MLTQTSLWLHRVDLMGCDWPFPKASPRVWAEIWYFNVFVFFASGRWKYSWFHCIECPCRILGLLVGYWKEQGLPVPGWIILSKVTLVSHHDASSLPPSGMTNTSTLSWWTLPANLTCLLCEMHMHYDYYSQGRTTVHVVPVRWSVGLTMDTWLFGYRL